MYNNGLVIGKFYPPHKGHKYLIETASALSKKLTVLVCQSQGQIIAASLRAKWIKEIHPGIEVMVINQGSLSDSDSKGWAKATLKCLGFIPDAVFTSEDYGDPYSRYLGCKHVLVDKKRINVPISATLIRNNLYRYWSYLEPEVKAYFTKRVCVIGAESTGTTSLSQELAKYYQTTWVPEYGRVYWEGKMFSNQLSWKSSEFSFIAKGQNSFEDQLAKYANRVLICDTNSWVTNIWHYRYLNKFSKEVKYFSNYRKYDLYIVTGDEIPFIQDGTRDGQDIRHTMHLQILKELKKMGVHTLLVTGNLNQRVNTAVYQINRLLDKNPF